MQRSVLSTRVDSYSSLSFNTTHPPDTPFFNTGNEWKGIEMGMGLMDMAREGGREKKRVINPCWPLFLPFANI